MARPLTTREVFMVAVFVIAGGIGAYYMFWKGDGFGFGRTERESELGSRPPGEAPVVRMDLLARNAEPYDPRGRNLFDYYRPPKPPPVERKTTPPPPPPPRSQVRRPVVATPKPEDRAPRPDFHYVGLLGPKENKIAVFDNGKNIVLARVGEIVQDRFRLVDFGFESVIFGYTDERYADQTTELRRQQK